MAWTTPRTWVTNEYPTAATFNTHLRDNLAWLGTDKPQAILSTGTQSISNAVSTAITFATEVKDVGGCHSTAANTDRITVPAGAGGTWIVTAYCTYDPASAVGERLLFLGHNGSLIRRVECPAGFVTGVSVSAQLVLAAGDYVNALAYQSSGGALNLTSCHFSAIWMST